MRRCVFQDCWPRRGSGTSKLLGLLQPCSSGKTNTRRFFLSNPCARTWKLRQLTLGFWLLVAHAQEGVRDPVALACSQPKPPQNDGFARAWVVSNLPEECMSVQGHTQRHADTDTDARRRAGTHAHTHTPNLNAAAAAQFYLC